MQNEKLKNKIYLNILLTILIIAISYFFIYPQYTGEGTFYSPENNISSLLKQKKDYTNALNIANEYNLKLSKVNKEYSNALEKLPIDTLNKILPSSIDTVMTVYQLTKIAALPGSDMLLTDPKVSDDGSSSEANKKFNTVKIDFSVKGNYNQLKFFLKSLENSEHVFNVTSLNFSSAQDSGINAVFSYSISVETYYLKQK